MNGHILSDSCILGMFWYFPNSFIHENSHFKKKLCQLDSSSSSSSRFFRTSSSSSSPAKYFEFSEFELDFEFESASLFRMRLKTLEAKPEAVEKMEAEVGERLTACEMLFTSKGGYTVVQAGAPHRKNSQLAREAQW